MKAIIMAGGEGTRLRPLTCDMPKPMTRLMDKPLMEYAIELIKKHGITDIAVTLGYIPYKITEYFGDGSNFGVNLCYYTEDTPLGTAGGVKAAKDFLDETFIVISGDGVTDINITDMVEFHREKGAKATIALARVENPMAYGLVSALRDGRIKDFVEKPDWGHVVTDEVNTGVYILEPEVISMIPDGVYDFGKQLFPEMARRGELYGYVSKSYWCDVGDTEAYLSVCKDALDGKIHLSGLNHFIHPSADISESADIEKPCYIGENAIVKDRARIGKYSVIGSGAIVNSGASVKRSVLWAMSSVGERSEIRGCVLAERARLDSGVRAFENCVIGAGAEIGAESEIRANISVWPEKSVSGKSRLTENAVWGHHEKTCFTSGAIGIKTPIDAIKACQAYAHCVKPREALLAKEASTVANAMWHSCASGLMAQGVKVIDAGVCTLPQLRYALTLTRVDGAILARPDGIVPLTGEGCRLLSGVQRSICACLQRQDYPKPFANITMSMSKCDKTERAYTAMLASAFEADTRKCGNIAVHSNNAYLLTLAEMAFSKAGIRARFEWEEEIMGQDNELCVWLSDDGELTGFTQGDIKLTEDETRLFRAWVALENGETRLLTGQRLTGDAENLCKMYKAELIKGGYSGSDFESALTKSRDVFRLMTDGIYFAISAISALTNKDMSLDMWRKFAPKINRVSRDIPLDDSIRAKVMRIMNSENGLYTESESGTAHIVPDGEKSVCHILAEATSSEYASELCDMYAEKLTRIISSVTKPDDN